MNWYKIAQRQSIIEQYPHYGHIGHYKKDDEKIGKVFLWISDVNGNNFNKTELINEKDEYDHGGFAYDVGLNMGKGVFQGRYDESKNIVSVNYEKSIFSVPYLPNRLVDRLKKEFGWNVKILDYSQGVPQIVI